MKISYNWIKDFIKTDAPAEETAELLTDLGLEVEGIETFETIKGSLKGIVVGHVEECLQHPNADKLKITKVNIGGSEILQIVCGAPNIAKGQKVPVATIGTVLYDEKGEAWKIKKGKLRGEESYGMICAEDELGLGKNHDGIMVLDESLEPGTPLSDLYEVAEDEVFEIGLTPNRADAMSHFGVARDLKAGLSQKGRAKELITPSVSKFHVENRTLKINVEVENKELAPRYCGVTISNVKVQPSPKWLQNRLKAIGITPKNNIVDATNYVLHELGQPLHAFDAERISGGKIIVKNAQQGEKFITLDEVERELHQEDLMICDTEKPLCIAGVLGGLHSGVTEHTTKIFLESAYFNPVSVRKTAKRHSINTDASFRFERGIDINNVKYALLRASLLIIEIAGGEISSDVTDLYPVKVEDFQVFLTFDKINKLIGQEIPKDTIKSILRLLDIKINTVTDRGLGLNIPPYRVDVQREVDVIEEILRVYGYNRIAFSSKVNASMTHSSRFDDHNVQNIIAQQLIGQGFYEIMSNSLTTRNYIELSEKIEERKAIAMLNPLSKDLEVMRQTLLFSGLEAILYNINHKKSDLRFFEFGCSYQKEDKAYQEQKHLTLFITGNTHKENWALPSQVSNFFMLKGNVVSIFERLGISVTKSEPSKNDIFQEGISLFSKKNYLGEMGVIRKSILKKFAIKQEVLFADIDWNTVLELIKDNKISYREIPKYPEVRRDLALLVDEKVTFEELYEVAKQTEQKLLKKVDLFDVYQGDKLPENKKSYALSFILQDEKQTLKDTQIDAIMNRLQKNFEKKLNAELR